MDSLFSPGLYLVYYAAKDFLYIVHCKSLIINNELLPPACIKIKGVADGKQ